MGTAGLLSLGRTAQPTRDKETAATHTRGRRNIFPLLERGLALPRGSAPSPVPLFSIQERKAGGSSGSKSAGRSNRRRRLTNISLKNNTVSDYLLTLISLSISSIVSIYKPELRPVPQRAAVPLERIARQAKWRSAPAFQALPPRNDRQAKSKKLSFRGYRNLLAGMRKFPGICAKVKPARACSDGLETYGTASPR